MTLIKEEWLLLTIATDWFLVFFMLLVMSCEERGGNFILDGWMTVCKYGFLREILDYCEANKVGNHQLLTHLHIHSVEGRVGNQFL